MRRWPTSFAANGWSAAKGNLDLQARTMLDEAVGYVAADSPPAAGRLLTQALAAGEYDER